ncbi:MAG TPA: hypothetical protein VN647_05940 [Nitrospira sp.]|nr:hypothetical protein [Nitrospira sp.]
MQSTRMFSFTVAILAVFSAAPAFSDTQTGSDVTWKCPQADGSVIYTNKEKTGCQAMALKPLSIVPDLENMPTAPRTATTGEPHYEVPSYQERTYGTEGRQAPDWASDWHASNTSSGSAQAEVCSLYMEWMQLVQKTRGGMFFGSDPSYGGDVTGRAQRMPSYSFYDNARYIALSRIFGTGFVPIGCF